MVGGWIVYYICSARWIEGAFAGFAAGLDNNPLIQFPFLLFLLSGYMNLMRVSREVLKKGKIQFALWIILPLGALLFFTGFFISLYLRESGQRLIGEGDIIKPPWGTETYTVTGIEPGLRGSMLGIEADKGIFSHAPQMTLLDRRSKSYKVGAFPPKKIDGTYYHILNFGIAPGIKLYKDGKVEYSGYMPLKILMPGSSDYFEIAPYPYRFLISLSLFDPKAPVYNLQVYKDEKIVAEGGSEGIMFDGYTLHFSEHTYWILLEAAKDPGMPVLILGILLIAIGIPVSLGRLAVRR